MNKGIQDQLSQQAIQEQQDLQYERGLLFFERRRKLIFLDLLHSFSLSFPIEWSEKFINEAKQSLVEEDEKLLKRRQKVL